MWVGLEVFPREFNYIIPRSLHLLDTQRAVFNMTPQCRQNALALSSHKAKSFFFRVMHTLKNGTSSHTDSWLWIDNHTESCGGMASTLKVCWNPISSSGSDPWSHVSLVSLILSLHVNLKLQSESYRRSGICKALRGRKGVLCYLLRCVRTYQRKFTWLVLCCWGLTQKPRLVTSQPSMGQIEKWLLIEGQSGHKQRKHQ